MFICHFRDEYLKRISSSQLDNSVKEALGVIQTYLYSSAKFHQAGVTVREISQEAATTDPLIGTGKKGVYLPETGEIKLVQGKWCIKTIIHETLHAASSIQLLREVRPLKPLFEGLTECLTGYLLYKDYRYTYSNCWKVDDPGSWCRMTYSDTCRLWGSFFHFVSIRTIIPLYFEEPPDWGRMCKCFGESVRQSGFPSFRDVLSTVPQSTALTFRNECARVFGRKFTIFSRTPVALDFSSIKQ